MNTQKTPFYVYLIIAILPFLFFYWMIPFVSRLTFGGDYPEMLRMQMELYFAIRTGTFPLYVPGFAYGHSSSALTVGQFFHPISFLASMVPGYWEGKLIDVNNLLKLMSLGFAHLVLFAFLRKIKLNILFSFIISLVTVYNFRILDLYRYGPALDAYIAHILLCISIGWYLISPTRWFGPLCIIGATYILVCNGHPQMMYYGLLGAGLFTLILPYFLSDMLHDKHFGYKMAFRFWLKVGGGVSLGIMLSSAYILPFYFDFMSVNVDRVGNNYLWALENLDTVIGTVNNFFLPLRSDINSAFGGSSLIIIPAILPVLRIFKIKIPRSVWIIWGLLLFMFLHIQGDRTPIHRLVWEYIPFASTIRVPGRISILMPIFIMMILVWVVKEETYSPCLRSLPFRLKPLTIMACIASLLTVIYYLLYVAGYHVLSSSIFQELFSHYFVENFFTVEFAIVMFGMTSLIALAIYSLHVGSTKMLGVFLIAVMVIQVGIAVKYRSGNWIKNKYVSPTIDMMRKQKKIKLDYLYYPGGGMHSSIVTTQLKRSFIEPFRGKIFTHVIPVDSQNDAYQRMERMRLPQQIFVEGYSPEKARVITAGAREMKGGSVKVVYSSFNRVQFRVNSQSHALFGLSYPYTSHWNAWVNGEKVLVYRANGAAHAVEIPEGESIIEFRYWSNAFFWGMVFSCATFAIIGLFACFNALKGLPRIIGTIIVLIISTGGFMLWYSSLYSGDNLETEYAWEYTPSLITPNLAYGKKNWLVPSVVSSGNYPRHARWHYQQPELYKSRLVDGDRSPSSGFMTCLHEDPAWILDLHKLERIKTIVLYESTRVPLYYDKVLGCSATLDQGPLFNDRTLQIAFSQDGIKWTIASSLTSPIDYEAPTRIIFEVPQIARYIQVKVPGRRKLSLDEVEVYGPQDNG